MNLETAIIDIDIKTNKNELNVNFGSSLEYDLNVNSEFLEKQINKKMIVLDNENKNLHNNKKLILYILTRDFRTSDNLTLYKALDESIKSETDLCVVFRFNKAQISKEENPYFSSNGLQFMVEALNQLSEEINITFIDPISDEEFLDFLKILPIKEIYITRDFTPFAKNRVKSLNQVYKIIEVDDITVYPIEKYGTFDNVAAFLKFVRSLQFPDLQHRNINWKDITCYLTKYINEPSKVNFVHEGKFDIQYKINPHLLIHPFNLNKLINNLSENLKGYSNKQVRSLIGNPKVSHLSAFLKFGLISIRAAHLLVENQSEIKKEDKLYFQRDLYFRDFFYKIAFDNHQQTFYTCNWEGPKPQFICEKDLLDWKTNTGIKPNITQEELCEIEANKLIFDRWCKGETEYPLINAAIKEMTTTGYMLNRTRMMTVSYLTWECGLWWKYAEKFFANHLTDYDWVINSINHQNIVNVGFYPSNHKGFNIKNQQNMYIDDKMKYYEKYDK